MSTVRHYLLLAQLVWALACFPVFAHPVLTISGDLTLVEVNGRRLSPSETPRVLQAADTICVIRLPRGSAAVISDVERAEEIALASDSPCVAVGDRERPGFLERFFSLFLSGSVSTKANSLFPRGGPLDIYIPSRLTTHFATFWIEFEKRQPYGFAIFGPHDFSEDFEPSQVDQLEEHTWAAKFDVPLELMRKANVALAYSGSSSDAHINFCTHVKTQLFHSNSRDPSQLLVDLLLEARPQYTPVIYALVQSVMTNVEDSSVFLNRLSELEKTIAQYMRRGFVGNSCSNSR